MRTGISSLTEAIYVGKLLSMCNFIMCKIYHLELTLEPLEVFTIEEHHSVVGSGQCSHIFPNSSSSPSVVFNESLPYALIFNQNCAVRTGWGAHGKAKSPCVDP